MDRLGDLSWPQALEAGSRGAILLIPVGSTEQHGPHLPLGTDTEIAVEIAGRVQSRLPHAVIAPALAYGSSGEHGDFAGTLSIGQEALRMLVLELVRSASATFGTTVLVSAHGGNHEPLSAACAQLDAEGRRALLWSPRWRGDAHAGRVETSVMLAIDPDRVLRERAAAGNVEPIERLIGELRIHGVRHLAPNGVLGDPDGASAEEGDRLLDAAADDLVGTVMAFTREPV